MNILFNASQCGLANNGGSKTIIRCAETLQDMGHYVNIFANVNNYTWHTPNVTICDIVGFSRAVAEKSVVVAVSVWDLESIIKTNCTIRYHDMFYYMRGWEQWVRGEQWLIDQIKKFVDAGGRIIVNSSWLIDQLKEKCGVDSVLCWAGLDLEDWESHYDPEDCSPPFVVGGCKYTRHKTKNSHTIDKYCNYPMNIKQEMDNLRLNEYYGDCHIWLAPTILEGFHQSAAEAALSGCYVIGYNIKSNGMGDYLTPETGAVLSDEDQIEDAIENPDFSKVPKMQKVLREKIGDREKNMRKFIEILEG